MGGQSLHDRQPGWADIFSKTTHFQENYLASELFWVSSCFSSQSNFGSPYHPLGHQSPAELINYITVTFPAQDCKAARAHNPLFELCFHWICKGEWIQEPKATPTNPGKNCSMAGPRVQLVKWKEEERKWSCSSSQRNGSVTKVLLILWVYQFLS